MSVKQKKLLVISVAALGWDLVQRYCPPKFPCPFKPMDAVFPALTCVAQASFRTASLPGQHGILSNGHYARELRKVLFWEQSAALVEGQRIWHNLEAQGRRVGMLFWQQSLGERLDLVLSPRPIHKHSGGMIQDCLSRPEDLYDKLVDRIGRSFNLMHYWGPLASKKSSQWIIEATIEVMKASSLAPEVLLTYLPHLDYDLQRYGPQSARSQEAAAQLFAYLERIIRIAEAYDYDYLVFGDYAIGPVSDAPVFPNRVLREAGLLKTRMVRGMAYPDFFHSEAFAMVDHEVALVFTRDTSATQAAMDALRGVNGIATILDADRLQQQGLRHARHPDLLLVARPGTWFAYPWWTDKRGAPDYATHIDIHNKPGYDPGELFFGWPPGSISTRPERIRGSHGLAGKERQVAWTSSFPFTTEPAGLIDLARGTQNWLEST
jgi:predicted AlkP superfamily pyrophosphatase or phosphodiesterase